MCIVLYCIVFIVSSRDLNLMDIEEIIIIKYQLKYINKLPRVQYNQYNIIKFIYLNIHPHQTGLISFHTQQLTVGNQYLHYTTSYSHSIEEKCTQA
jgi:ABC-type uncharacterized transport system permease subunit